MKTSKVFSIVRDYLRDGGHMMSHERYICYAVNALYLRGDIGDRDRTKAKRLIRGHLGDCGSLEHWLYDNYGIRPTRTPAYNKKIMATRKAWLTHLINHYEAQGD